MNRSHPGIPPGRRSRRAGDWRERLRKATRALASKLREIFELDDPEVRRHIIEAVRPAIGEDSRPDLLERPRPIAGEGTAIAEAMTACAYRGILEGEGLDRKDPVTAESFMAEVVTAPDEEMGLGWRTNVRTITRIMVATHLETHNGDIPAIRSTLLDAAREALSDRPPEEMVKILPGPASADGPADPEAALSKAGMYRMVLDCERLDRQDARMVESFMGAVVAALDAELPDAPSSS